MGLTAGSLLLSDAGAGRPRRHRPPPPDAPSWRRCRRPTPTGSRTAPTRHTPGPEGSGTAFLTYGLARSVGNGTLDAATYTPVVTASWRALTTTALRADGLLGYVQACEDGGRRPPAPTATDTAAYGVGGFLLAGQEMARLTPGC